MSDRPSLPQAGRGAFALPSARRPNTAVRRLLRWMVVFSLVALVWRCGLYSDEESYRLTLEIDTPAGTRSASSIVTSWTINQGWIPGPGPPYLRRYKGEAVFLDLGDAKNAVLLLTHGARDGTGDGMIGLPGWAQREQRKAAGLPPADGPPRGPLKLVGQSVPTIVTFKDRSDPWSMRLLNATDVWWGCPIDGEHNCVPVLKSRFIDAFATELGEGYALRAVTVEIVRNPLWRTSVIENQLPFLRTRREELARLRSDWPPRLQPRLSYFKREF